MGVRPIGSTWGIRGFLVGESQPGVEAKPKCDRLGVLQGCVECFAEVHAKGVAVPTEMVFDV